MNLVSGAMVFFVIWWVVLFITLPLGVQVDNNPPKGFASGVPKNPQLGKKFFLTTVLTVIVWGIVQFIMLKGLIRFSDLQGV